MEIQPNLNSAPLGNALPNRPVAAKADPAVEQASFGNTAALENALRSAPDSRADEVARAKELVSTPQYPPAETLEKISILLAGRLMDNQL